MAEPGFDLIDELIRRKQEQEEKKELMTENRALVIKVFKRNNFREPTESEILEDLFWLERAMRRFDAKRRGFDIDKEENHAKLSSN